MAFLSFMECKNNELDTLPIVPGQLVFVTDTYKLYHTTISGSRQLMSHDFTIVNQLPTEDIKKDHLYILITNDKGKLYIYTDKWIKISGDGTGTAEGLEDLIQASKEEPVDQEVGGLWLIVDD